MPHVVKALTAEEVAECIVRDVAELPDRTSPDDWPEAMLVTGEELLRIVVDRVAGLVAAARIIEWLDDRDANAKNFFAWRIDHPELGAIEITAQVIEGKTPAMRIGELMSELEAPLPLIIHCPKCHLQHVDVDDDSGNWATTRHHRKHLCKPEDGGCGHVFMPSLRNTVGVRELPEVAS